jgi:hypothetical protein
MPAGPVIQATFRLAPGLKRIVGSGSIVRALPGNRSGIHPSRSAMGDSEWLREFALRLIPEEKPEAAVFGASGAVATPRRRLVKRAAV